MAERAKKRRVCVMTGTRAEFGLLVPVMDAVGRSKRLELCVVAAGSHLLGPARTIREVRARYKVAATVPMQQEGKNGRAEDAAALGRGVLGCARAFAKIKPDWVVVLGDRIEAFAAASAASVAGIGVCHIHGGDRAEGIADEAMRHAITKLSHLHCAATKQSARRIVAMGERREHVHVTGSPAIDGLAKIAPMSVAQAKRYGDPNAVVLLHPSGQGEIEETLRAVMAASVAMSVGWRGSTEKCAVLLLDPNNDAGREHIASVWEPISKTEGFDRAHHLPREVFVSLLKRLAARGGCMIGNSSAGLIEAAAIGLIVGNIGPRQEGRERAGNVVELVDGPEDLAKNVRAITARLRSRVQRSQVFGDGRAGARIADLLARTDPGPLLRKQNAY